MIDNDLYEARYSTINRSKKSVKEIALDTGIKSSTLYAYGNPTETPGSRDIPLNKLVPIMKATGNYSILQALNQACGFLMVRVPRVAINRQDDNKLVNDYQKLCTHTVSTLIHFIENPSKDNYQAAHDLLNQVMCSSAGIQRRIEKFHQTEMPLDV